MRADELVALASAHGIDLQHVAGAESNTKGKARKRRMGPEERKRAKGRPITETAEGVSTRVLRPRAWSHAEVAICAGGLELVAPNQPARDHNGEFRKRCPRMPWLAICYSAAGDRDRYKELHRGLTLKAVQLAEQRDWPWQVELLTGGRAYYLERLAELVLDEEACRWAFVQAPGLYAIYMGVGEDIWQKPIYAYFLELQGQYGRWLDTARGVIAQWMKPGDLPEPTEATTVASEPSNAA